MSDFEHELLDLFEKNGKFDPAREEVLRLQVTTEFDRKKRRLLVWAWVWHAGLSLMLLPGIFLIAGPWSNQTGVQGLALIVMATAGLVTIKLWYWIVHGRLEVLRELKRLELRLLLPRPEAQTKPSGS